MAHRFLFLSGQRAVRASLDVAALPITRATDIEKHGFAGSMSRKGNCYNNAPIESLGSLNPSSLLQESPRAEASIREYIEMFNIVRRSEEA